MCNNVSPTQCCMHKPRYRECFAEFDDDLKRKPVKSHTKLFPLYQPWRIKSPMKLGGFSDFEWPLPYSTLAARNWSPASSAPPGCDARGAGPGALRHQRHGGGAGGACGAVGGDGAGGLDAGVHPVQRADAHPVLQDVPHRQGVHAVAAQRAVQDVLLEGRPATIQLNSFVCRHGIVGNLFSLVCVEGSF